MGENKGFLAYYFIIPYNGKMNVQRDTTIAYFDVQAAGWASKYQRSPHFKKRLETVSGWVQERASGIALLDYGCGSGVLLQRLVESGYTVTGVDASTEMLTVARQALEALPPECRELGQLEPVNGRFEGAYLERTYDGITCLGVLEYLETPQALLEKLASALRPGGFLILSFPNKNSVFRKIERLIFRYASFFRLFGLFSPLTEPESYLRFQKWEGRPEDLEESLKTLGFQLTRKSVHVAPALLGGLEACPVVGMTVIAEFVKLPHHDKD